jgi:D-glycero-D-manno-heptose 1,7-bisphosphate phosphatase
MTAASNSGKAVFLDRDGTLIREVGYLRRVEQIEILPQVPAALRLLREYGFKLVVVTNQSAVARGWLSERDLLSASSNRGNRAFPDGLRLSKTEGWYD